MAIDGDARALSELRLAQAHLAGVMLGALGPGASHSTLDRAERSAKRLRAAAGERMPTDWRRYVLAVEEWVRTCRPSALRRPGFAAPRPPLSDALPPPRPPAWLRRADIGNADRE